MAFQPFPILGYKSGLKSNKKPFLFINDAFQTLFNAYVWRETVKKREGIKLIGRLRRCFNMDITLSTQADGASYTNADILNDASINVRTTEPNAQIEPGSLQVTVGALVFTENDPGNSLLSAGGANIGTINYTTGELRLEFDPPLGAPTDVDVQFCYFPGLPVMGIDLREIPDVIINDQTIFFDTKYVYVYDGNNFDSPSASVWAGSNSEFFWMANYRGIEPNDRVFYATNFALPALDPNNRIRYTTDAAIWNDLEAQVSSSPDVFIFQARLIIPYYGRLLLLNTWEGENDGNATNFFNRCRFSQIGNPLESTVIPPVVDTAWLSDVFGRGGFIDAPTNESIISARFYKNTLIVFFERTTWQLRYVGEYGLPFLWERISSDFGSESTFSTILFDEGVLAVGDKAIVSSSGNDVRRIDLEIPDTVFSFQNSEDGKERVQGIRDYQKEIVYWTYVDPNSSSNARIFPNRTLLYNYRNDTWATFRDNATAFGTLHTVSGTSWDLPISWDSATPWDLFYNSEFPNIVSGNHQGFIHLYQFVLDPETVQDNLSDFIEHESLFITAVTLSDTDNILLTIPEHNLEEDEIIYLAGTIFVDLTTNSVLPNTINDRFYQVQIIDNNTVELFLWDPALNQYIGTSHNLFPFDPEPNGETYMGGGLAALFPRMDIVTKDFNPLQERGSQIKTSYTDFQVDRSPNSCVTINAYVNSMINPDEAANLPLFDPTMETSLGQKGIITNATQTNPVVITSPNHGLSTGRQITLSRVVGMTEINGGLFTVNVPDFNTFSLEGIDGTGFTAYERGGSWWTVDVNPFYTLGSNYAWHRFYSNVFGQYITYQITYNDSLMNNPITHDSDFQLNGMILYIKPGGRLII